MEASRRYAKFIYCKKPDIVYNLHASLCEFNLYKTEKQFNAINIELQVLLHSKSLTYTNRYFTTHTPPNVVNYISLQMICI